MNQKNITVSWPQQKNGQFFFEKLCLEYNPSWSDSWKHAAINLDQRLQVQQIPRQRRGLGYKLPLAQEREARAWVESQAYARREHKRNLARQLLPPSRFCRDMLSYIKIPNLEQMQCFEKQKFVYEPFDPENDHIKNIFYWDLFN